jgi:hypothetical protein
MLSRFRCADLRRLLVALILATFVPVTSSALACQARCDAGEEGHGAGTMTGETRPRSIAAGIDATAHLMHSGPCHLSLIPALAQALLPAEPIGIVPAWPPTRRETYVSETWPPPEPWPRG